VSCIRAQRRDLRTPTTDNKRGESDHQSRTYRPRWPVERTNSWLSNFGQLRRSTDRSPSNRLAQMALAVTLLLTAKLIDWRNRGTAEGRLFARPHSSVRHIDRESLVTGRTFHLRKGTPYGVDPPVQVLQEGEIRGVEALDDVRSNLIALEAPQ